MNDDAALPPRTSLSEEPTPEPERLGGALALIYWSAVVILIFPVVGIGALAVGGGPSALAFAITGVVSAPPRLLVAILPLLALIVWAAVFVTLTTVRSRSGRRIATVLFVVWGLTQVGSQIALQTHLAPGGANIGTLGPLLPHFVAVLVSVAAFAGYMSEGRRPRRWFSGG